MTLLPNAVNEPTLARLARFIHEDLGYSDVEPTRYTVRELICELCKFNTSGTLCWVLSGSTRSRSRASHGGRGASQSTVSDDTTRNAMNEMASAQRVFARCAQPVVEQVESVLASAEPPAPHVVPVAPVPLVPQSTPCTSSFLDEEVRDWLKRLRFEMFESALGGASSLLDLHFLVTDRELTAASLEEQGLPTLTIKRFIREVEKVGLVAGTRRKSSR